MNQFFCVVKPVIRYPSCIINSQSQDCFNCMVHKYCDSPRALCVRAYPNHKKGCPNYGTKTDCPPNAPMYDMVFDLKRTNYAIYSTYDIKSHVEEMRVKHPSWTEMQLYNVLYWQGSAKKQLSQRISDFKREFPELMITRSPEAMGVDVTETLRDAGIILEWPARNIVYKVALAGYTINNLFDSQLI